ncbi:MAG TPA: peptide MFS transporter, partial [Thermoanaerobaculia bacterium]|nr:peptide MFS transporter [Thermoanaerobaculia bacterium]
MTDSAATSPAHQQWFGHPRALATLFFTEMWERFSYYGMRALLILFMTAPLIGANPGLGYGIEKSAAIYGLYTSLVYLLALPGGWIADQLWGQRRAVFVGGVIIALGHFSMAAPLVGLPDEMFFFLGLLLIVIGTGLLKPNVSTIVGDLYPRADEETREEKRTGDAVEHWGARRDAGFSIFYMGINVGAILGPFICSTLGEGYNFHWGFSAAGFGMILGLIQYKLGEKYFGSAGLLRSGETPEVVARKTRNFYLTFGAVAVAVIAFAFLVTSGIIPVTLQAVATWLGYGILLLVLLFFSYLIFDIKWAGVLGIIWISLVGFFYAISGHDADMAGRNGTLITLAVFILLCVG